MLSGLASSERMREGLIGRLQRQLPSASEEKLLAIERILAEDPLEGASGSQVKEVAGLPEYSGSNEASLLRIEGKIDALLTAQRASGVELSKAHRPEEPISESEAAQVFRLFGELLGMGTDLVAPPARVFDLMVFKKMTKAETAVECKCVASLITKRVALIERHFAMPIERLRAFASDLKERQRTVRGDRYAKKKRGAVQGEPSQFADGDRAGAREDEDGYLPEERPGYD
jgi:hypothetical protein